MQSLSAYPRGRGTAGVAAVEFVIVMPVLLLLWFGMINLTHYIATQRKLSASAQLIGDLVTRHDTTISASSITDYYNAVTLEIRPLDVSNVRVDIYDFFKSGNVAASRWEMHSPNGQPCTAPTPDVLSPTDPIGSVLGDGNDVVVAVVCMPYNPPVANYPGLQQIFGNVTIQRQSIQRPRQSTTLTCTDCPKP